MGFNACVISDLALRNHYQGSRSPDLKEFEMLGRLTDRLSRCGVVWGPSASQLAGPSLCRADASLL